jgi:hypothetical protein
MKEDFRRLTEFLFQNFRETSAVLLVILLSVRRIMRNLFSDDPVLDQMLKERCHERTHTWPGRFAFPDG